MNVGFSFILLSALLRDSLWKITSFPAQIDEIIFTRVQSHNLAPLEREGQRAEFSEQEY